MKKSLGPYQKILGSTFILLVLLFPLGVLADHGAPLHLNLDYPAFGGFDLNNDQFLPQIIAFFYYFIVGISGLVAFVMLVWGGIQWLTSGAIPSQASEAKDRLKNAILGLLLILASVLIIQIINPELIISDPLGLGPSGGSVPMLTGGDPSMFLVPTVPGVYVCRDSVCACANSPCVEGSYDDNADYFFYNPATWAPFSSQTDPGGLWRYKPWKLG